LCSPAHPCAHLPASGGAIYVLSLCCHWVVLVAFVVLVLVVDIIMVLVITIIIVG
jgi:hypothetical protein